MKVIITHDIEPLEVPHNVKVVQKTLHTYANSEYVAIELLSDKEIIDLVDDLKIRFLAHAKKRRKIYHKRVKEWETEMGKELK